MHLETHFISFQEALELVRVGVFPVGIGRARPARDDWGCYDRSSTVRRNCMISLATSCFWKSFFDLLLCNCFFLNQRIVIPRTRMGVGSSLATVAPSLTLTLSLRASYRFNSFHAVHVGYSLNSQFVLSGSFSTAHCGICWTTGTKLSSSKICAAIAAGSHSVICRSSRNTL